MKRLIVVAATSLIACSSPSSEDETPALRDAAVDSSDAGIDADTDGSAPADGGAFDAEFDAPSDAAGDAAADASLEPMLLSESGLYSDISTEELAPGVMPYAPRYELWSDAAEKRRWLFLPPGTTIDTSDMDYWSFPVGTRVWKEFSRDGVRVETRVLLKAAEGQRGWYMMAYVWNEDQTDAVAVPDGQPNARGTEHDVPAQVECRTCHGNVPDILLGVSAIQLDHAGDGATLRSLDADGWLSAAPPSEPFLLPGSEDTAAALGYLHANCGTCHNPHSTAYERVDLDLRLLVDALATPDETPTYLSTIDVPTADPVSGTTQRVVPGEPSMSQLYVRMTQRGTDYAMPPLASEHVDESNVDRVGRWIDSLSGE